MRYRRKSFALALAIGTCASLAAAAGLRGGRGRLPPPKPRGPASRPTASEQAIASRFEAIRAQNEDLEFPELLKRLKIARRPDARPGFDPTRVAYYDQINKALALTPEEQSIYARTGIVGVDHGQRTTMANAYLGIYHRDLPVLITTDSILHAMHRSFDTILMQIEMNFLAPTMKKLLAETRTAFNAEVGMFADPQVRKSAADVDLYLTVALNLLEGNSFTPLCEKAEAGQGGACAWPGEALRARRGLRAFRDGSGRRSSRSCADRRRRREPGRVALRAGSRHHRLVAVQAARPLHQVAAAARVLPRDDVAGPRRRRIQPWRRRPSRSGAPTPSASSVTRSF